MTESSLQRPFWDKSLFLLVVVSHLFYFQVVPYDNVMVRLALTFSIVGDGTLAIDKYADTSADKSFYDGHYYSDKAPGVSFLGVPVYAAWVWLGKILGGPLSLDGFRLLLRTLILSIPTGIITVLLFRLCREWGASEQIALAASIGYALGTPALPYATVLYGHQLAAVCCFGAWWFIRQERYRRSPGRMFLVGLLFGFAWWAQYPAAFLVACLYFGAAWIWRKEWQFLVPLAAGVAVTILAMGVYNYACFDSPLAISYQFKDTAEFAIVHSTGLFGIALPRLDATWTLLFSTRKGLFFFSPLLLLTPLGLWRITQNNARSELHRNEAIVFAVVSGLYMLLFCSFVDFEAGYTFGPRHMVPMLPFLAALLGGLAEKWEARGLLLGLGWAVPLFSFGTAVGLHIPVEIDFPLANFWYPMLAKKCVNTTLGSLMGMLSPWASVMLVMLFACVTSALSLSHASNNREALWLSSGIAAVFLALVGGRTLFPPQPTWYLPMARMAFSSECHEAAYDLYRDSEPKQTAYLEGAQRFAQAGLNNFSGKLLEALYRETNDPGHLRGAITEFLSAKDWKTAVTLMEHEAPPGPVYNFLRGNALLKLDRQQEAVKLLNTHEVENLPTEMRLQLMEYFR